MKTKTWKPKPKLAWGLAWRSERLLNGGYLNAQTYPTRALAWNRWLEITHRTVNETRRSSAIKELYRQGARVVRVRIEADEAIR